MTKAARKIVKIDPDKCNGCGLCVPKCAEGAIQIVDGKARLAAENLCDGLGNCLGECPRGAITIEERPAEAFDEQAVAKHLSAAKAAEPAPKLPCGCPGTMARRFHAPARATGCTSCETSPAPARRSELTHWPVQLTLLAEKGDLWQGADVLFAADCVAYAMADFHERLLAGGKTLAVACPKLDDGSAYVEKLARIFANNDLRSITIARMEVPCCGGLERIVRAALEQAGCDVPVKTIVVSVHGELMSETN
ncbi:MAG TPA: 4Fe-4S ferredoxin [Phycisphaerales bacterium]|nr:4Fe-4S ferredoxin [Phycisphaerales bacterium]